MSSDAHYSFLRRLGPPDHLFNNADPSSSSSSNPNPNPNGNGNQNHPSTSSSSTSTGLRYYLDAGDAAAFPSSFNPRDPFPPAVVDRDQLANQPNQDPEDQIQQHRSEEDIAVRLQDRESISVPWHLLPPYQTDDLDILPSEAHPSYPYGVPFLPTSLPPYSSKPKLPPLSSNSLQYISNSHFPPSQRGNNTTNRPHLGTQNQPNSSNPNNARVQESLSRNCKDLPIDLKMKSKVSTILKPSQYPFKNLGPGKFNGRNPKRYFNRNFISNQGDFINHTQLEIWSDLGLEEILPKGKEKDPLIDLNQDLNADPFLLSGSGGIGTMSAFREEETQKEKGSGWTVESELNRSDLPFLYGFPGPLENDLRFVVESYAYGNLSDPYASSSTSYESHRPHPAIVESEKQKREEHVKQQNKGQSEPNINKASRHFQSHWPLSKQLEIRTGLDRSERIWAAQLRMKRVQNYLEETLSKDQNFLNLDLSERKRIYNEKFWRIFKNIHNQKNIQSGNTVFEKEGPDGARSSRLVNQDTIKEVDNARKDVGIKWGE